MGDVVETFHKLLQDALKNITREYYNAEIWQVDKIKELQENGASEEDTKSQREILQFISRHSERTFCYELYHQIKLLMNERDFNHVMFQGEFQKRFINRISEIVQGTKTLKKQYIPDFLLHSPSDFDYQYIVMEVKTKPNIPFSHIKKDVEKLDQFIDSYHFQSGIFLIVNTEAQEIRNKLEENKEQLQNLTHHSQISIYVKSSSGKLETINLAEYIP